MAPVPVLRYALRMKLRHSAAMIVIALLCLAAGAACEHWRDHRAASETAFYVSRKWVSLDQQADKAPRGIALLIGDSITENAWVPTLCGYPAFNAGISGARVWNMIGPAKDLAMRIDPAVIVVALGTNDVRRRETPVARFARDYEALLAPLAGRRLILVAVPPIHLRDAVSQNSVSRAIARENAAIARIADAHRALFVAPPAAFPTVDGVHPTPAGSETWKAAIQTACTGRR